MKGLSSVHTLSASHNRADLARNLVSAKAATRRSGEGANELSDS